MKLHSLCVQPLTVFSSGKCKRCGFYEEDRLKSDDVFEEWELCPSDFTLPDGKYIRVKDKEFSATFLCSECIPFAKGECFLLSYFEGPFTTLYSILTFSSWVFGAFGHSIAPSISVLHPHSPTRCGRVFLNE